MFLALAGAAALVWLVLRGRPLMGDERVHLEVISGLTGWLQNRVAFSPSHPAIPGYHLLIAAAATVTGLSGVEAYRAFSTGINTFGAVAGFALASTLSGSDARLSSFRMAQTFFLAIAFPFVALLYTDIGSAGLVLLSFALVFKQRYALAGAVSTLSVAVRQNNILWLGLVFVFACLQLWRNREGFRSGGDAVRKGRNTLLTSLPPFVLGFAAFVAFVIWNEGHVALADQGAHPPFTFHMGNVWGATMTAFLVFFPLAMARAPHIVRLCRDHGDVVWLGSVLVAVLYFMTLTNTHPYNHLPWWLHNKVVMLATSSPGWRLLFLVPVLYQTLVFLTTPLWRPELRLLYPASILYLGASWLIEPRYYFIPLLLFLLFRRPEKPQLEAALVAWNGAFGMVLLWGMYRGIWFL